MDNSSRNSELLAEGYVRYEVLEYSPDFCERLDRASNEVPQDFPIDGSLREESFGGKGICSYIALEGGKFVVYLPPTNSNWGSKSQMVTPGFQPSQKVAEIEFNRWLEHICKDLSD